MLAFTAGAQEQGFTVPREISFAVGQSAMIYAVRDTNCGPAPSFDRIKGALPKTALGIYSDGGLTSRRSKQCGGVAGVHRTDQSIIPARGIAFTATSPGSETLNFFGDRIAVTVH